MASEAISWKDKAQSAITRARTASKKHEEVIDATVRSGLTFASAFGFGFYNSKASAKTGRAPELLNMPVPLIAGLALKALTFTRLGDKHAAHLDAIGDGALAAYGAALGAAAGLAKK